MRTLAIVLALGISVSACVPVNPRAGKHLVGYETRTVEIVRVDRPKHFSVDVRDVATGQIYENAVRTKHCNYHASRAVIGRRYDVPFSVWEPRGRGERTRHMKSRYLMTRQLEHLLCSPV